MLDGYIDIYLPDFKYFNNQIALKYSKVNNYKEVCMTAIEEMYKQVGKCKFQNGILKKGIIVRHLMLPEMESDAKKIIEYLYNTYQDNIFLINFLMKTLYYLSFFTPLINDLKTETNASVLII